MPAFQIVVICVQTADAIATMLLNLPAMNCGKPAKNCWIAETASCARLANADQSMPCATRTARKPIAKPTAAISSGSPPMAATSATAPRATIPTTPPSARNTVSTMLSGPPSAAMMRSTIPQAPRKIDRTPSRLRKPPTSLVTTSVTAMSAGVILLPNTALMASAVCLHETGEDFQRRYDHLGDHGRRWRNRARGTAPSRSGSSRSGCPDPAR